MNPANQYIGNLKVKNVKIVYNKQKFKKIKYTFSSIEMVFP